MTFRCRNDNDRSNEHVWTNDPRTRCRMTTCDSGGPASADDLTEGEHHVGGALGEAAHVPRIPGFAIGDQVTDRVALARQASLLVGPDAVQHLDLERGAW